VQAGGGAVGIRYPELDTGSIDLAFDGDLETLARTRDAQTTIVEVRFPQPRPVDGVRLHLWTGSYGLGLTATTRDGQVIRVRGSGSSPVGLRPMELWFFDHLDAVTTLEIEISKGGDGHVHLREIEILPAIAAGDRPDRGSGPALD
jgi:hypothetical protein